MNPQLPAFVDPIWHRHACGDLQGFARNSRGLHVPISAMTIGEQCLAPSWLAFVEAVDFEKLDAPCP